MHKGALSIGASFSPACAGLRAEEPLLSDRNNNALFIINLATDCAETNSNLRIHKCVNVSQNAMASAQTTTDIRNEI